MNPYSPDYGNKGASRGPTDQLPDPQAQTQYLQYNAEKSESDMPRTSKKKSY